jgi:preprotein translocase subunit SecB
MFDATTKLDREAKGLSVHTFLEVVAGDALKISAEFALEYSVSESPIGITDEAASAFGKMTGIHNVWPYWREYVQSVSVRAGFPPLVLPLVTGASLVAYYSAKDASDSTCTSAKPQGDTK